jgi:hypothetical protein
VWQGAAAIARVVRFSSDQDNITGNLINTSYELLSLETRFLRPLEENYDRWGDLATNCYMKHVWEFLYKYKITLRLQVDTVQPPRENDALIMEVIRSHLSVSELKMFNMCRLYLQVLWISDITMGDGASLNWYGGAGIKKERRRDYITQYFGCMDSK